MFTIKDKNLEMIHLSQVKVGDKIANLDIWKEDSDEYGVLVLKEIKQASGKRWVSGPTTICERGKDVYKKELEVSFIFYNETNDVTTAYHVWGNSLNEKNNSLWFCVVNDNKDFYEKSMYYQLLDTFRRRLNHFFDNGGYLNLISTDEFKGKNNSFGFQPLNKLVELYNSVIEINKKALTKLNDKS